MKATLNALVILISLISFSTIQASSESLEIIEILSKQIQLMDSIEPTVERVDLSRLVVIRKAVNTLKHDIENNKADGKREITRKTMRLLDNLIIQFKYSQVFFGWEDEPSIMSIYTPSTKDELKQLQSSYLGLIDIFGLDDSPYTTITMSTFSQIHKLLNSLEKLSLDDDFKASLRALWPSVGKMIATASVEGDRLCTFLQAIPVIEEIRSLYLEFNNFSSIHAAYPMIIELQGLTEFYADFGNVDRVNMSEQCE
jgi:hypothetical protein